MTKADTFQGEICVRNHPDGIRYVATKTCVQCEKERNASDKRKAEREKYREHYKNTPQRKSYCAEYESRLLTIAMKKSRQANGKAKTFGVEGLISGQDVINLCVSQNYLCWYCETECREKYQVDHCVPLARGGLNDLSNVVIACPQCNLDKHLMNPEEYMLHLAGKAMAIASSSTRYMGTPCYKGHDGLRYVRDRGCVSCKHERVRRQRLANKQKAA